MDHQQGPPPRSKVRNFSDRVWGDFGDPYHAQATAPYRHAVAVTRARLGDLAGIDRTHDWVRLCETHTQMWYAPELDEHTNPERALLRVAVATTIDPDHIDRVRDHHARTIEQTQTVLTFQLTRLLLPPA